MESFLKPLHQETIKSDVKDKLSWKASKKGVFLVKSYFKVLVAGEATSFPVKEI